MCSRMETVINLKLCYLDLIYQSTYKYVVDSYHMSYVEGDVDELGTGSLASLAALSGR